MNGVPKVSVLTPIYNTNPEYLKECIESILNQTFTDFEFIILNDSPENVALDDLISSYTDSRIRYYRNERNLGISPSRNKLLDMAKGEYVAIFDHDDISVSNRLQLEAQYLDLHPEVGVVSGLAENFGTHKGLIRKPENNFDIRLHLVSSNCVIHSAAMIRKSVLIKNNIRYESDYTPAEDYQLWARLMLVTNFYNIQQVMIKYRVDGRQATTTMQKKMHQAYSVISTKIRQQYPEYWRWYCLYGGGTIWKIRLFGIIPFLKMKKGWVYLFECIPLFKYTGR